MRFEYSDHWQRKRMGRRKGITDDMVELAIRTSKRMPDRKWKNAFNAVARVPPSGRTLKVVFRPKGDVIKIITAYWLD